MRVVIAYEIKVIKKSNADKERDSPLPGKKSNKSITRRKYPTSAETAATAKTKQTIEDWDE
jgi:hypothetical protein